MKQDQKQIPKRGFAAMNEEKRKEIASKGGHAAHEQGVAHEWNSQQAKAAGKKSGKSRRRDYFKGDDLPIL
jgi:general stress protein YciG